MFKQGLFENGSRCLFMDLDTVIVGSLAEIVKYEGKFATLRDFYFPQQYGPAVIAWEAGEYAGKLTIAKLNVDENPATAANYGVTSIPTMNVYQGGQIVKQIIGAKPKGALLSDLAAFI